jgi:hypothetical protein
LFTGDLINAGPIAGLVKGESTDNNSVPSCCNMGLVGGYVGGGGAHVGKAVSVHQNNKLDKLAKPPEGIRTVDYAHVRPLADLGPALGSTSSLSSGIHLGIYARVGYNVLVSLR